jgi:predicted nuclease of predicted toxin-antitoxin system
MATLLEQAIKALQGLPKHEQKFAAAAVLDYAHRDDTVILSDADAAEVRRRMTAPAALISIEEARDRLDA